MDTITHGIVGALIGKAFFADNPSPACRSWREPPANSARATICAATLGAVFPDIDTLAGPIAGNGLAIMTWHRGITHSLVLLPVWATALAFLTRWLTDRLRWPAPTLPALFLIYAVALGSHIFLDVITAFGTMIWSPVSYARFAWDWIFIVDLTLTSLALAPQLAAWAFGRPERASHRAMLLWGVFSAAAFALIPITRILDVPYAAGAALAATIVFSFLFLLPLQRKAGTRLDRATLSRVGVILVVIYILFAATMHHNALRRVTEFVKQSGINAQTVAALPLPPWPARWAGLIATQGGLYRLELDEFNREPAFFRYFPQAPPNRYIAAARQLPDVQIFHWFARFPLFEYSDLNGQPVVLIIAMPFYRSRSLQRSDDPGTSSNFTYRVVFSPEARVLSHGWVRPE